MNKHVLLSLVCLFAVMGAGCGQQTPPINPPVTPPTAQVPTPPVAPTPAPTPTPAPAAAAPLSTISVTGAFSFSGNILVSCSPANPISNPTRQPPLGWQMRGGSPGRVNGNGAYIRLNVHNGNEKRAGAQVVSDPFGGKTSVAVEFSSAEGQSFKSFLSSDGKPSVTFTSDLQGATVVGELEDALGQGTIQVNANVKCQ